MSTRLLNIMVVMVLLASCNNQRKNILPLEIYDDNLDSISLLADSIIISSHIVTGKIEYNLDEFLPNLDIRIALSKLETESTNDTLTRSLFERAVSKQLNNDFIESLMDYEKLSKLYPDDPKFYWKKSLLKFGLSDFRGAIQSGEKAFELTPDSDKTEKSKILHLIARSMGLLRDIDKGLLKMESSLSLDKNNALSKIYIAGWTLNFGNPNAKKINRSCLLLSEAGEAGYDVYEIIKEHCN